jgi:hypothetical protein
MYVCIYVCMYVCMYVCIIHIYNVCVRKLSHAFWRNICIYITQILWDSYRTLFGAQVRRNGKQ